MPDGVTVILIAAASLITIVALIVVRVLRSRNDSAVTHMTHRKRRVHRTIERHYCPHNDMMHFAHHFKQQVERKLALPPSERTGVALDQVAVLTYLAFAVEAQLNFIGDRLVVGWNERSSYAGKMAAVLQRLNIALDPNSRPALSLSKLKTLRDMLAHPKPDYSVITAEMIVDDSGVDTNRPFAHLYGPWHPYCDDYFFAEAYDDVETFWQLVLKAAGLRAWDAMTRSADSSQFIDYVDE